MSSSVDNCNEEKSLVEFCQKVRAAEVRRVDATRARDGGEDAVE
jgi:hypothetical protein